MKRFTNRKYSGWIRWEYRAALLQHHLDHAKRCLSGGIPLDPTQGNCHLYIIGMLADTNMEWNLYKWACKQCELAPFKPII